MAGFENDVLLCSNVNFNPALPKPHNGLITTNGQMIIGSTALNPGGTHLNIGTLTSPGGTITIGYSSPNITIDVTGGGVDVTSLSDDNANVVTPIGGNIQLVGHVNEQAGKFSTVTAGLHLLNINPMSASRWIVDPLGFNGTHSTIGAAIASASAGDTIFIMPGKYTENLTLKPGVNLTAYGCDGLAGGGVTPTSGVTIVGKCTYVGGAEVTCSGIAFNTNSDFALVFSGSTLGSLQITNCFISAINNTAISFTNSNANSFFNITYTFLDLFTTGIAFWSNSSPGFLDIKWCRCNNTVGLSTTASNSSAGVTRFYHSEMDAPISCSSTGALFIQNSIIDLAASATAVTLNGIGASSNEIVNSLVDGGTGSAVSIGVGAVGFLTCVTINSSNVNTLTGAGTLKYGFIAFQNGSGHNVAVETALATLV